MKSLLLIIPLLFLTGCAVSGNYKESYISQSIEKNYKKIDSVNICVFKNDELVQMNRIQQKVISNPGDLSFPANKITNEISSLFLKQYFSFKNNTQCDYYLNFKTVDMQFYFTTGVGIVSSMTLEYEFYLELLKNDKVLLSKKYNGKKDTGVLMEIPGFSTPIDNLMELFHKEAFFILENQAKQDILNAL